MRIQVVRWRNISDKADENPRIIEQTGLLAPFAGSAVLAVPVESAGQAPCYRAFFATKVGNFGYVEFSRSSLESAIHLRIRLPEIVEEVYTIEASEEFVGRLINNAALMIGAAKAHPLLDVSAEVAATLNAAFSIPQEALVN